jgi:phosphodiester glycosidase
MPSRPRRDVVRALAASALVLAAVGLTDGPTDAGISHVRSWRVAPGVHYRQWRFTAPAGPQRVHVLEVNPHRPGVSLGYRSNARLQVRAPTSRIIASDPFAVGGTNGNYFDIAGTGAPLGIGRNRTRGVEHAPRAGWNDAFYQAGDGSYQVGTVTLTAHLAQHPTWPVTGLNVPHDRPDSITLYTPRWGRASGRAVVDGRTPVREVHVNHGVVRQNTATLRKDRKFHGLLLIGVGSGAQLLKTLPVGSPLDATWALDPRPQMAITGSQVLVRGGHVVATNDHVTAPRTAVGIDTATGHVLLVTLDGRQPKATGMTMRGWARLLKGLGVDDAVNLDGGGSSTMVARSADGSTTGVVNRPSLGRERQVPDALTVDYAPPTPSS